jgi:hypothetical protein
MEKVNSSYTASAPASSKDETDLAWVQDEFAFDPLTLVRGGCRALFSCLNPRRF